jgi:hypothetical protein
VILKLVAPKADETRKTMWCIGRRSQVLDKSPQLGRIQLDIIVNDDEVFSAQLPNNVPTIATRAPAALINAKQALISQPDAFLDLDFGIMVRNDYLLNKRAPQQVSHLRFDVVHPRRIVIGYQDGDSLGRVE